MGLFESIKNTFSKGEPAADVTTAPSQLLREAGLDPSGLKFGFGNASITVSGEIARESDRQKIVDVLSGIPGIESVQEELAVVREPIPEATATAGESVVEPTHSAESHDTVEGEVQTYTVVSGDTLWKIADRMYGDGSQYTKIFEANTDVLNHPDRIFPGQKLVIPKLQDRGQTGA